MPVATYFVRAVSRKTPVLLWSLLSLLSLLHDVAFELVTLLKPCPTDYCTAC